MNPAAAFGALQNNLEWVFSCHKNIHFICRLAGVKAWT